MKTLNNYYTSTVKVKLTVRQNISSKYLDIIDFIKNDIPFNIKRLLKLNYSDTI